MTLTDDLPTERETVPEVVAEFKSFLNDALATHAFARMGLLREHELMTNDVPPATPENPDPMVHMGEVSEGTFAPYARWRLSEARAQLDPLNGPIQRRLGDQLLTFVFAGWEHEYRSRLERAHDLKRDELKVPILGDLRLMRNDVLHHHGVATSRNSGRCSVLAHWVTIGEPIAIGPDKLWEIFPWSLLEKDADAD